MNYAIYESMFGDICIGYSDDTVIFLKKVDEMPIGVSKKTPFTDRVFKEISEYFEGERKVFTFRYELKGTDFQKKVWEELSNIPYGETRTYKEIAAAVGNDKASRAVGMANNKNPITIVVPCHRVIGSGGKLVGYAGGMAMKEGLLKIESDKK